MHEIAKHALWLGVNGYYRKNDSPQTSAQVRDIMLQRGAAAGWGEYLRICHAIATQGPEANIIRGIPTTPEIRRKLHSHFPTMAKATVGAGLGVSMIALGYTTTHRLSLGMNGCGVGWLTGAWASWI